MVLSKMPPFMNVLGWAFIYGSPLIHPVHSHILGGIIHPRILSQEVKV